MVYLPLFTYTFTIPNQLNVGKCIPYMLHGSFGKVCLTIRVEVIAFELVSHIKNICGYSIKQLFHANVTHDFQYSLEVEHST